ncbi:MAG: hypothetical protein WDZ91_00085 [Paenibacillaceae bacterium]
MNTNHSRVDLLSDVDQFLHRLDEKNQHSTLLCKPALPNWGQFQQSSAYVFSAWISD